MCYIVFGVVCLVCSVVVFLSNESKQWRRLNVAYNFVNFKNLCTNLANNNLYLHDK